MRVDSGASTDRESQYSVSPTGVTVGSLGVPCFRGYFGGRVRNSRMWGQGSARKGTRRCRTSRHVGIEVIRVGMRVRSKVIMIGLTAAPSHGTVEIGRVGGKSLRSYYSTQHRPRQSWRHCSPLCSKPWHSQLPHSTKVGTTERVTFYMEMIYNAAHMFHILCLTVYPLQNMNVEMVVLFKEHNALGIAPTPVSSYIRAMYHVQ